MVTFEKEIEGCSARALALFLSKARRAIGLRGEVDVVVTTNRRMRLLNKQFRRKDKPTDVLSFPTEPTLSSGMVGHPFAGELAISGDIAKQNGRALGHGTLAELKILVLHGVLHLAGHDHENDDGQMARKEQKLRRELGLPDGLIERAEAVALPAKSRSLDSADATNASAPLGMTKLKKRESNSKVGRAARTARSRR